MPRGIVISDLHLFSVRSAGEQRLASIRDDLAAADVIVLNGDTFDFRWSHFRDEEKFVEAALDWLRRFAATYPQATIHFICGNHDCLDALTVCLDDLAQRCPSLSWHETHLLLGTHLFVHGDCAHRRMDAVGLGRYREVFKREKPRAAWLAQGYRVVDRIGITWLAHRSHFGVQGTLERLTWHLDRAIPEWRATTRDCYFGHTHLPFRGRSLDGVRFHNTGCGIAGSRFAPVMFEI
ncbi:metallophosphoesterase [Luteolibacter arcticus]|uniref:Metallophosphoesterase n=1 Tax=Luteolibacter arcticus TaxID=1581411 RepID=A0ABT3GPM6_9BACT|nr:metallophosphoesterase [Luteolibacter arcticus]MCW1925436.1 metallophosphoesterase [Luteolibacter arcticus]